MIEHICANAGLLSAEEEFLAATARIRPAEVDIERARSLACGATFSWEKMFTVATQLWVHPIVAHTILADTPLLDMTPAPVRMALQLATFAARMRRSMFAAATEPIFAALREQGVTVTLLKGGALCETLYPAGTRMLNDLDVWVDPNHFGTAAGLLEAEGFMPASGGAGKAPPMDQRRSNGVAFTRVSGDHNLSVDLHYRLYPAETAFQLDAATCSGRGHQGEYGAVPVRFFSPEDTVLHLATQIAEATHVKLTTAIDIAELVRAGLDWDSLIAKATAARANGAAYLGLGYAAMLGAEVPAAVLTDLRNRCRGIDIATGVLLDPRALFPRNRLAVSAAYAIKTYVLYPGRDRRGYLRLIPGQIRRRSLAGGRSGLRLATHMVRSLGLLGLWWALLALRRLTEQVGFGRAARVLRELFWMRQPPGV